MTQIGIVGASAYKVTASNEVLARVAIRKLLVPGIDLVVSGACDGMDQWAVEEARAAGIAVLEFPAKIKRWTGPGGFEERNIKIAHASGFVVCLTVPVLPDGSSSYCYHCHTAAHVKSGGCWTVKFALKLGKVNSRVIIV